MRCPCAVRSIGVAALLVILGASQYWSGQAADAQPPDRAEEQRARSSALAAAPTHHFRQPAARLYSGVDARSASAVIATAVPLPEGGNFNGIQFETVEGPLTDVDLDYVLQYNAACQWVRALVDGRDPAIARQVARDIPRWPTFRGNERGQTVQAALADLGRGAGRVLSALLTDCVASHAREVAYARSLGLPPST